MRPREGTWAEPQHLPDLCQVGGPGLTTVAPTGHRAQEGPRGRSWWRGPFPTLRSWCRAVSRGGRTGLPQTGGVEAQSQWSVHTPLDLNPNLLCRCYPEPGRGNPRVPLGSWSDAFSLKEQLRQARLGLGQVRGQTPLGGAHVSRGTTPPPSCPAQRSLKEGSPAFVPLHSGTPFPALTWPARPSSAHVEGACGWWPSLPPSSSASRGPAPRAPRPQPARLSRRLPLLPPQVPAQAQGSGLPTGTGHASDMEPVSPPARAAVDTHLDRPPPAPGALHAGGEKGVGGGGDSAPGGRAWVPGEIHGAACTFNFSRAVAARFSHHRE